MKNRFLNLQTELNIWNEKGAILPLFAIVLVGIISMLALSVDQSRGVLVHQNVEDMADAVALAAVSGFDGTVDGLSLIHI